MMLKKLAVATAVLALSFAGSAFADTTTTFVAPVTGLNGTSLQGFTFTGNWQNYGYDPRNAPFMESYGTEHSVSYDAGAFNFKSISLGGLPWDNYSSGGNNTLTMVFKDLAGNVIESDNFSLPQDNSFQSFAKNIAGVHEITFSSWGFWPRLDSITQGTAGAVPEPQSYAMVLAGLFVVGAIARRNKA